jgi:hypothetical protein
MSSRHVAPVSQWSEPRSNTRLADPVYYIFNGTDWSPDDTGPADGYQDEVSGAYEISTSALEHDGLALIIDGVAVSR